jgi:N-formylglutamate amidohydrolase
LQRGAYVHYSLVRDKGLTFHNNAAIFMVMVQTSTIFASEEPSSAAFDVHRGDGEPSPVLLSVPHAGREYTPDVLLSSRFTRHQLRRLEDRYADVLVQPLLEKGQPAIVARMPRAVIDLNRDPRDIDPRLVHGLPHNVPLIQSAKQRGGLGLFPRTLPGVGDIWRGPMEWEEAERRRDSVHAPYHQSIADMMERASLTNGVALLLDIHSMPPLSVGDNGWAPEIVIGDRYGSSASTRLSAMAQVVAGAHGYAVALNHPYAGSYITQRHGMPHRGRHAIQIEVSRALYLDTDMDQPDEGLVRVQNMLSDLVNTLSDELGGHYWLEAAE